MRAHLHLTTPDSDRFGREHAEPWDDRSGWYTHAATLEIEPEDTALAKLEAVFDLTQHGRDDWTDGDAAISFNLSYCLAALGANLSVTIHRHDVVGGNL